MEFLLNLSLFLTPNNDRSLRNWASNALCVRKILILSRTKGVMMICVLNYAFNNIFSQTANILQVINDQRCCCFAAVVKTSTQIFKF